MSLQVWLPLNGSLENLGFADVGEIDTTHITFSDNGKIGKCLTGYTGYFNIPSMTGKKQLSVAYWVRVNTATATNWLDAFRWYSTAGSSFYSSRNEFYNNCTNTGFWFKGGSISGKDTTVGEWHHHAFTIDYEAGTAEFYIDGVSVGSSSAVDTTHYLTGTSFMIGENGLDTSHNDVRIYDHILSAKEVKELSKGLVAHYPLNDFLLTNFSSEGNIIPDYKDMKLGSANPSTGTWRIAGSSNMTRSRVHIDDSPIGECYCFVNSGIQTANDGSCYGIDSFPLSANTEYCISMLARIINGEEGYAGYNIFNIADELGGSHSKIDKNYRVTTLHPDGSWTYCWYHFKTNSANARNIYIGITTGSTTVTTQMCLVRIEEWQEWMSDNTIYDCSGYGHNGTLSPTPPVVDADSARYFTCMKFNGSNNYIDLGINTWLPTDQITVSMWVYRDVWQSANSKPISCTESGGFNFEEGSGGGYRFPVYKKGLSYAYGTPVKKWASYTPGWHFLTGTFDGYVSKIYIDGEYDCGSAASDTKALIGYNANAKLFIGCEAATANPHSPYLDGKISYVRIYCTALSEKDVKALYETSVSVDDKGNFHAYEISEV